MRRVLIFIPEDYAAGGIQRSAVAVHDCLSSRGYDCSIHCTRLWPGGLAQSHAFITAVAPIARSKAATWLAYFREMRRLLRSDDVVAAIGLGLFPAIALPIASWGLRSRPVLIGSERAYPPSDPVGPVFRTLRGVMFRRLDEIVCQTRQIADWFAANLQISGDRLAVIPNVVRRPARGWRLRTFAGAPEEPKVLVAVGRFDPQKGFDFALQAFARIRQAVPDAKLILVGEGPLEIQLRELVRTLGLADCVEFRKPMSRLSDLWSEAYALLFTSRYEGFPNVLAEAMAHGVPAVAFDCPTGPSDLIEDGRNSFLVKLGDVGTCADRAIHLLGDASMRDRLGVEAQAVASRFSLERVADLWAGLLDRAGRRERRPV